ncbi:alpha/beta fold hydrolase [bacterium]|nr:MAG: alpha/beta fold hydrolase [bacterium]
MASTVVPDDRFLLRGADGEEIAGDLYLPAGEGTPPLVLILHGFKGFKHWGFFPTLAQSFADNGIAAAALSLSHCGVQGDTDQFNRLDLFEKDTWGRRLFDVQQVVEAAARGLLTDKRELDRTRLGILGHSMGGGLGVLYAARDPRIRALVTLAAVSTANRFPPAEVKAHLKAFGHMKLTHARTGQELRVGPSFFEEVETNPEAFDIRRAASRLEIPWLLIHGVDDQSVAFEESLTLLEAANTNGVRGSNTRLLSIENTDHVLGTQHPFRRRTAEFVQAVDAALDFFKKHL